MARNGRPLPQNVSKPVDCELPGYEGVSFTYIISQTTRVISAAEKDGPFAVAALVVNETPSWPFEIEPPKHGDVGSFEESCPLDLISWVISTGYQKAVRSAVSPN